MAKDNIDTAAVRTTYGSRFFDNHVPNHDAPGVRRLREAGFQEVRAVALA